MRNLNTAEKNLIDIERKGFILTMRNLNNHFKKQTYKAIIVLY